MWIFPKSALGHILAQVHIWSKFPSIFQQTAFQTTKARGNANRHSAAAAQHNTHAVIATLNLASRLVYRQPGLINLRVQHHQERWRWSEASRSRGAACLYELFLENEPSFKYEGRAHTQHTTHHKTKTTQHNIQTTSTPTANPTTAQLDGGKRPRDSSALGVLCSQRAGTLDIVRRAVALLLSRPEAVNFRWHFFFCTVFVPDVAHGRSCCSSRPLLPLSRECLHFDGRKLNRVDGQSCCAAVLTATLGHTEGGRRLRCILHMKQKWSTKHSFFYQVPGTL